MHTWKKSEAFSEYAQDKIIFANKIPIDEDKVIDYMGDGITDLIVSLQIFA